MDSKLIQAKGDALPHLLGAGRVPVGSRAKEKGLKPHEL